MNSHQRYLEQAGWTRKLRSYIFERIECWNARRILEVGCGTGAILRDLFQYEIRGTGGARHVYGIDLAPSPLAECTIYAPGSLLTRADAHSLPFGEGSFEITYCHFLLLWTTHPMRVIQEMKRVTRKMGHVLALAEPDYSARVDRPEELVALGAMQTRALEWQGANTRIGSQLAELFGQAGIRILETGIITPWSEEVSTMSEFSGEWQMLESDLSGMLTPGELEKMHQIDLKAQQLGERILYVPTHFAWGQV